MSDVNPLEVLVKEAGVSETKAQFLFRTFNRAAATASDWEERAMAIVVTDDSQTSIMNQAREARLILRETRIDVEKKRKELKQDALREGQLIDGIAKTLKGLIQPLEDHLEKQEHFVENRIKAEEEERKVKAEALLREQEEAERVAAVEAQKAEAERIRNERDEARAKGAAQAASLAAERKTHEAELAKEREAAAREMAEQNAVAEELLQKERREAFAGKERQEAEYRAREDRRKAAEEAGKITATPVVTCPACGHVFGPVEASK